LWRLYPAYAVSVIGTFLLLLITAHGTDYVDGPPNIGDLISHLTLTHGYFDKYFYSIVHVYWSLALEFELYIAYPLFLYLFVKAGLTRSIIFLSIFSLLWRFIALHVFHLQLISVAWTGPYAMMGFVFARMPEWLFGAWLAEWFVRGGNKQVSRLPLIGIAVIGLFIAILSTLSEPLWVFTDMLFGLGFAFIVAAAIVPRKRNAPILTHTATTSDGSVVEDDVGRLSPPYRWLIWVGMISYSLYLFHMQFSWFANPWIRQLASPSLQFVLRGIVLLISIPLIAVVYRFVEKPFLSPPKKGERFYSAYAKIGRAIGIKSGSGSS
jgi:peptidoglycan/LPS O-acetylase OafA/YrhL